MLISKQNIFFNFQEMYRRRMNSRDKVHIGPLSLPGGKEVLKPVTKLEKGPNGERILDMGNRGLMLNVITPLQKFSKGGATISDVIKQRFQDIFQREMSSDLLQKTEDVFTKKKEVNWIVISNYLKLENIKQKSYQLIRFNFRLFERNYVKT